MEVESSGFIRFYQVLRFGVQALGFRASGAGFRAQGLGGTLTTALYDCSRGAELPSHYL